jgi:hypothetical protein
MTSLEEKLKSNKKINQFKEESRYARKELDRSEDYVPAALKMQIKRVKSAEEHTKVLTNVQAKLSEIRLNNQAYRSRIIRFKTDCVIIVASLSKKYKLLRKFIGTMYAKELTAMGYKTKTDRDAWIDTYFFNEVSFLDRVESAIEIFDVVIEDIDSQGFAIKDIINILSIEYKYRQSEI